MWDVYHPDRLSGKFTNRVDFSGRAGPSFQNERCFLSWAIFREKGNNLTSTKGFLEERDGVHQRRMVQEGLKPPNWSYEALAF